MRLNFCLLSVVVVLTSCQEKSPSSIGAALSANAVPNSVEVAAANASIPALQALEENPDYKVTSSDLEALKQQGIVSDSELVELKKNFKL